MKKAAVRLGLRLLEKPKAVEASLWRRLKINSDASSRTKLFNKYLEFSRKIAVKQFYNSPSHGLELPDFEQLAIVGLLETIDKFDPLKNIPFEAYARYRIKGSILDGLSRSNEKSTQYSHQRRVEAERIRSLHKESANTSDAISQISELAVGLAIGYIIDGSMVHDESSVDLQPGAYETLSWRELQLSLTGEIRKLTRAEKIVIEQHYIHGVTFVEIAKILELSKGRISQLHRSAIEQLRKNLGPKY